MAYTLADYSRLAGDNLLKRAVIETWRKESLIMDSLSFENAGKLSIKVIRSGALPTVYWRKIGEGWTESKGTTETVEERVFIMGGYYDFDKVLERATDSIVNQRALQNQMYAKALALEFNNQFINGNPVSDEDSFVGIWYRLYHDMPAAQSIDGASIDISADSGATTANFNTFFDKIEALIDACDGHSCDMLLMNSTTKLRIQSGLRQLGLFTTTQDSFGRSVPTWGSGGPKLVDIGLKADQSTKIITDTELANGTALTGGTLTSVYALKLGQQQYLGGFQEYDIDVNDVGLLESGVAYRTVIDWPVGIYMVNPRSIARLYGVQAA